jgi:hypothetical protein
MKQNLPRKPFVAFCVFSGQTLITEHARIARNRRPKEYLRETRRIWLIAARITRIPEVNSDLILNFRSSADAFIILYWSLLNPLAIRVIRVICG